MDIHLVRVPKDVDVVNITWKPEKWGERPALFSVHVDSYVVYFNVIIFCCFFQVTASKYLEIPLIVTEQVCRLSVVFSIKMPFYHYNIDTSHTTYRLQMYIKGKSNN